MRHHHQPLIISLFLCCLLLTACSTTSDIPEGDRLYTGLKAIEYKDYERNSHFLSTQEEI